MLCKLICTVSPVFPIPARNPYLKKVGSSRVAGTTAPTKNQRSDENCRRRNWKYNASAAYGTNSTQDKCSCIVHVIAAAIIRLQTGAGIKFIVVNGYSSSTATKNRMLAGKQYGGLKVVVDT